MARLCCVHHSHLGVMCHSLYVQRGYADDEYGRNLGCLIRFYHHNDYVVSLVTIQTPLPFRLGRSIDRCSLVLPALPGGKGYQTSSFVWTEWTADIGYPDGFVFILGMLNGAYGIGTPDVTT